MTRIFDRVWTCGGAGSAWLIALVACWIPAYGQQPPHESPSQAMEQSQHQPADKMGMPEEEVAHPFFTHMGVPVAVGVFNLRFAGLASRTDGDTVGDFAFHFETGLTDFIGLHVRNDRFLEEQHTEVMFQFAAVRSKNKMSGFSPIMEFEIPTLSGNGTRIHTLVGFRPRSPIRERHSIRSFTTTRARTRWTAAHHSCSGSVRGGTRSSKCWQRP